MLIRTPPPSKRSRQDAVSPPSAERGSLAIYEDLSASSLPLQPVSSSSEPHLCTYQCRQMVKSEFLDALNSAEKQVIEYKSNLEDLNSRFCQADVERKNFRDLTMSLQQELAAAKARERALQEQLLKDINDSEERYKKQLELQSAVEIKFKSERDLRQKAESEAAVSKSFANDLEAQLHDLSETIEREKKRTNQEHEQSQNELKSSISKLALDLDKMECRAENAENESNMLNNQLESLSKQLKESLNEKNELEKKLAGLSYHEGFSNDSDILIKHLQEELRKYEVEVREARKLKQSREKVEILEEKLLEEKNRRERAEAKLSRLQAVELDAKKLDDELASWKSIANKIPGVSCPDDMSIKFSSLQKEVIDNMTKIGDANAHLKQLQMVLDATETEKKSAETEAAIAKDKMEALKHELKQKQLLISAITIDKDALTKVVEELKKSKSEQSGNGIVELLQDLEPSLSEKENCIKQLENDINEANELIHRQLLDIELLNDKLNTEGRRLKSLERENDRLLQQMSLLESKLGHGEFSAANTKVLRMVNNPSLDIEAKQTIETLLTELQKAKQKLSAVEELKTHSGTDGKLVEAYISGQITQLKEQIATLEKREERYKAVFADRISVFRRACCELFGYKIVMDEQKRPNGIPVTRFTLSSIYAQSDDEKLDFEYESGVTNILGNEYTSQPDISRQIEVFIRKMNSIPAFTANLTVESFNRRTFS